MISQSRFTPWILPVCASQGNEEMIMNGPMTRAAFTVAVALLCHTAVAAPEQVTCDSPCDCQDAHGEGRWSVKTDASLPPTDASAIQAVTPSDMFSWPGPDAPITMQSERGCP